MQQLKIKNVLNADIVSWMEGGEFWANVQKEVKNSDPFLKDKEIFIANNLAEFTDKSRGGI